jgi:hypothetical protein
MATATLPETRLDPRVLHPLDRLRGTIRKYVVIEGLLSAAIFVAAWFALGLAFDFGLFKIATWDWALDAPAWLRGGALVIAILLLAGIVVFRIAVRLTRELSYPALALVLERRFPKVLGDRLITAVELADVERQSRYGYSSAMIRQTIDEARDRVGTVPVNEVFNWRRLRRMAALAVGLFVLVVVAGFVAFAAGTKTADPVRFGWKFAHVTGTFLERNVLIRNVPWPRRAHLEFIGFDSADRRIPKDSAETTVKVKAYRWVIADRTAPMGWRPLAWGDLNDSLAGGSVPQLPARAFEIATDKELTGDPAAWSADQVQAAGIEDPDARKKLVEALSGPEYESLRNDLERVFAKLDEQAASPSMGRTLRKLDVPEGVKLVYSGATKTGEVTLGPQKNQEFSSPITDLKESVHFVVRAEDFRTPGRTITLIPPPVFVSLTRTEFQPAYLHHTPPDFNYASLRGLRQRMADKGLSLTGDRSVFSVNSGTELELTAKLDTDLVAAYLQPKVGVLPGARPGSAELIPILVAADKRTVTIEFKGDYRLAAGRTFEHLYFDENGWLASAPVTTQPTLEFDLIVEQEDRVTAKRQIMIQIAEDQAPVVELAPDVIRKVGNVYYVTPKAKIPFNPESYIRDDHGLSKVAYEFTYWSEDSDVGRALRAQLLTRSFMYPVGPASTPNTVAAMYHAAKFKDLDKGDQRQTGSAELSRYLDLRRGLQFETMDTLRRKLNEPRDESAAVMIPKIELKSPEVDFFDLKSLKLLASASEVQTRYRLDLNVVATDANYDTGPKTGQNSEAIRLLIVSEGDLLAEINKEEDAFMNRMDEAITKLVAARNRFAVVRSFYNQKDRIEDSRIKTQDVSQEVGKAQDIMQGIGREYHRIHRECIVNDVIEVTRDRFGKYANKIDRACGENPPPVTKDESTTPPAMTFPEATRRLEAVLSALNANSWGDLAVLNAAELALLDLERVVRQIRAEGGEGRTPEKLRQQLRKIIDDQERIRKDIEKIYKVWEEGQFSKAPDIGASGPVFLTKGETKRLKHTINWRQYDKDELVLKLAAVDKDKKPVPADALGFPTELKLDFEKNQLSFEYDVKAGAKEGEYTLTITPAVGDAITVQISVK